MVLCIGICEQTVYRILNEKKSSGTLSDPKISQQTVFEKFLVYEKNLIRLKVHKFFFRNEVPTVNKILNALNSHENLPNFKKNTFWKILNNCILKTLSVEEIVMLVDKKSIVT